MRPFIRRPSPKKKLTSKDRRHISVSGTNYAIIRRVADQRGVPMSKVVTELLERAMAAAPTPN
jgi:hypothetical protein